MKNLGLTFQTFNRDCASLNKQVTRVQKIIYKVTLVHCLDVFVLHLQENSTLFMSTETKWFSRVQRVKITKIITPLTVSHHH